MSVHLYLDFEVKYKRTRKHFRDSKNPKFFVTVRDSGMENEYMYVGIDAAGAIYDYRSEYVNSVVIKKSDIASKTAVEINEMLGSFLEESLRKAKDYKALYDEDCDEFKKKLGEITMLGIGNGMNTYRLSMSKN